VNHLISLFETLAQVSFAVTGLLLVVVAGDAEARKRWFGTPARQAFTQGTLYLILLPGFVSLSSLIPPFNPAFATWPFAAGGWSLICGIYAYLLKRVARKEREKYSVLEDRFFKTSNNLIAAMILLVLLALYGLTVYSVGIGQSNAETMAGLFVTALMVLATINVMILLNVNLDPENAKTPDEDTPKTVPAPQKPVTPSEVDAALPALSILAVAAILLDIVLVLGWLCRRDSR